MPCPLAARPVPCLARVVALLAAALLLALVAAPAAGAQATSTAPTTGSGTRTTAAAPRTTLEEVQKELMCSTCRVPLEQSDAPQAQQERKTIERLIAAGLTKDQVIAEMVEIYSESVLIHPPEEGVRTLRWLIPAIAALVGFLLVVVLVTRWRRSTRRAAGDGSGDGWSDAPGTGVAPVDGAAGPDPSDDELSTADRARLDADLDRYA